MTDLAKQTPKQKAHFTYMMEVMQRLEWDIHNTIEQSGRIPEEWYDIALRATETPLLKVNLRLERDVVKYFKSMGDGYGARINEVLKTFMHARLAGVIRGAETINHHKRREEDFNGPKPQFGDLPQKVGQNWRDAPDPPDMVGGLIDEIIQKDHADHGMPDHMTKPGRQVRATRSARPAK